MVNGYHEALCVLTGEMPLDLVAKRRSQEYKLKKSGQLTTRIRKELVEASLSRWQARWDESNKGRTTFAIIPDIAERLLLGWLKPDHYTMQALTGRGKMQAYFFKHGLMVDQPSEVLLLRCRSGQQLSCCICV